MLRYILAFLTFFCCLGTIGCSERIIASKEIDPDLDFKLVTKANVQSEFILRGTDKYKKFIAWLDNNQEGWRPTYASLAKPLFLLSQEGFTFLCFEDAVVIQFKDGNEDQRQYSKTIEKNEVGFLVK